MNNGSYGIMRMSDVDINDIDVHYTFMGGRGVDTPIAKKIKSSDVITNVRSENGEVMQGLYNFKLPSDIFNTIGVYNIVLTPRGINTKITDNGVLASRPDVKGIVIDLSGNEFVNDRGKMINGALDGYRIEYKGKRGVYRIVTSSNRCEPINDVSMSTSQKQVRYRFSELSNLMYLTLTPSGSNDLKVNSSTFLGEVGDEITIFNTQFDPIMLEVELVDTTLETLKNGLFGNQIETKDGKLTIYTDDENRLPFKEYNLFTVKDQFDTDIKRVKMEVDISSNDDFDEALEDNVI